MRGIRLLFVLGILGAAGLAFGAGVTPTPAAAAAPHILSSADPLSGDTTFDGTGGPYQIQDKISVVKGIKHCKLFVGPGAQIHGGAIPLDGVTHIEIAGTPDKPAILRDIDFQQGFQGYFKAQYAILENCKFHKSGSWYAYAGFTAKWELDKCLIRGTSFPKITHVDTGIKFTDCTFSGMTFGDIIVGTPKDKPLDYMDVLRKDWRTIDHCRFDDCSVPPTIFWCATASDYTKCRFPVGPAFESDTPTDVVAFVSDTDGDAPDKILQATPPKRAALHITYVAEPFQIFALSVTNVPAIGGAKPYVPDNSPKPQPPFDDASAQGPTTRPARLQSSIRALYVVELDSGFMVGQANDFILTITRDDKPRQIEVVFPQRVGDQMHLVVDDIMRFLRLQYPKWNVARAELTFADKYNPHDGGSIGAAIGTLILSTIRGFEIDPKTAITGDVSADGKVRAIGGVAAKLRGAAAAGCDVVAVPADNEAQVADGMVYVGPSLVTDVQVITIGNLDDAQAVTRSDRSESLTKAIALFSNIQAQIKGSGSALKTVQVQAELRHVLELVPQHLSAKLLLRLAANSEPKTLSATASMYYTFVAARPMLPILKYTDPSRHHDQVPAGLSKSLEDLQKLRAICDPQTRPLIAAWTQFIRTWNSPHPSANTIIDDRNRVVEQMQRLNADQDLMQKMISEGI